MPDRPCDAVEAAQQQGCVVEHGSVGAAETEEEAADGEVGGEPRQPQQHQHRVGHSQPHQQQY